MLISTNVLVTCHVNCMQNMKLIVTDVQEMSLLDFDKLSVKVKTCLKMKLAE